jgi:hypothetical protein
LTIPADSRCSRSNKHTAGHWENLANLKNSVLQGVSMTAWTNYSLETISASAANLVSLSIELQSKLLNRDQEMTPDETLLLLNQINSVTESMRHVANMVVVRSMP